MHFRNHRLRDRLDLGHHFGTHSEDFAIRICAEAGHFVQIVTSAERRSSCGENNSAGFAVALQFTEARDHFAHQRKRQRVALGWAIQRDDCYRAFQRNGQMRIRHGVPPAFMPG